MRGFALLPSRRLEPFHPAGPLAPIEAEPANVSNVVARPLLDRPEYRRRERRRCRIRRVPTPPAHGHHERGLAHDRAVWRPADTMDVLSLRTPSDAGQDAHGHAEARRPAEQDRHAFSDHCGQGCESLRQWLHDWRYCGRVAGLPRASDSGLARMAYDLCGQDVCHLAAGLRVCLPARHRISVFCHRADAQTSLWARGSLRLSKPTRCL